MFEVGRNFSRSFSVGGELDPSQNHARRYHNATNLFRFVMFKGQILRLVRRLLGHRRWLYDLTEFKSKTTVGGSCYAGIKVVDINKIVGTEGRTADFDIDFYPVSEKSRERWVNMVLLYSACCTPVPPVELIQIGDVYFVRDGHHRVSVARARGQKAIDAEVTVWHTHAPVSSPQNHHSLQPVQVIH